MKNTNEILEHIKERFATEERLYKFWLNMAEAETELHHWKNAERYENEANEHQCKKNELNSMYAFITGESWVDTLKVLYAYAKEAR
ncbi:MAG: hypothetical protein J6S85_21440 [Methanobrevibacter sp.]|nr:hypothetical protein [Methanobrevibacter sp.]